MITTDINALFYAFCPQTSFRQLARVALAAFRDRGDLIVLTDVATPFDSQIITDDRTP